MSVKSKPDEYVEAINKRILPHIDYEKLEASYNTDMAYAKGVLNSLHEVMTVVYGGERLWEQDGDDGFVTIPGVVRGKDSGNMCIALLDLDLSSSGEHWGTTYLCKYGVISQTSGDADLSDTLKSQMREMNVAFIPYDYCYTAVLPDDIHVQHDALPDALRAVLTDFRNHRAVLLHEEKLSVVGRLRETAKKPDQPAEPREKPKEPGPER